MIHYCLSAYWLVFAAAGYALAHHTVLPRSSGWSEASRIAFALTTPAAVPALLVYLTIRAFTDLFTRRPPWTPTPSPPSPTARPEQSPPSSSPPPASS